MTFTNGQSDQVEAILLAAQQCYEREGIAASGMKEVARRAGLARSTIYRYFPGRDELLIATVQREMQLLNTSIQRRLNRFDDPAERIVEGLVIALREIPRRPLLRAVFMSDEDGRARRVIWASDTVARFGVELMAPVMEAAREADLLQQTVAPEVMAEWVYRLLLSFLTLPSNVVRTPTELRATLRALLIPVLLK